LPESSVLSGSVELGLLILTHVVPWLGLVSLVDDDVLVVPEGMYTVPASADHTGTYSDEERSESGVSSDEGHGETERKRASGLW